MAKSCRNGCGTPATPDHQSTAPNEEGSPRSNTHVQMLSQATTTNITNISFGNVAQVINISGTNQTVHIPQPTVQILQQSIGTDGVSSNAGTQSSHHFPHQSQPVWSGSAPSHLPSESLTSQGSPPEFAEGPPVGPELVELTQILMGILKHDWICLGDYLTIPEHEVAAAKVDEPTLYRKINRLLRFWSEFSEDNDRKSLVQVLPPHVAAHIRDVLKKRI